MIWIFVILSVVLSCLLGVTIAQYKIEKDQRCDLEEEVFRYARWYSELCKDYRKLSKTHWKFINEFIEVSKSGKRAYLMLDMLLNEKEGESWAKNYAKRWTA